MTVKKITSLAIGLIVAAGNVGADEYDLPTGFTISPMIGHYIHDKERDVENDTLFSLGLGYQFDSPWGIELNYLESDSESELNGSDVDLQQLRLDALYHLERRGSVLPYVAFGAGENEFSTDFGDHKETIVNAGGGFKYFTTPNLSIRGDIRVINSLDEEDTDLAATIGLNYTFGKAPKRAAPQPVAAEAPAPAPVVAVVVDTDGDGVPDSRDQCNDTEQGAKVDANGCYIVIEEGHSIELKVNFATNSSVVTEDNFDEIAKVAKFMREYPQTSVVIEGHTDDTGDAAYNQDLSERRAKAVAAILLGTSDIDSSRVSYKGYGESAPLHDSSVNNYRALNRRVVAVINVTVEKVLK